LDTDGDGRKEWFKAQRKSLDAVVKMVEDNGATILNDLIEIAEVLNNIEE
jgi:hypothetical protein